MMPGMRTIASKLLACGLGVAFFLAASRYPLQGTWLIPILALYAVLLGWRFQLCLFVLPALLPVLDLAPWTGWFFIEEIDLLLLLTAAFGYWKMDGCPLGARLPGWAYPCIAVLLLAYAIGIWRGLLPLSAIDINSFTDYLSPYNSLRVGKSWLWAMLLLPIMLRYSGSDLTNIKRYFVPGMLTGLALVSCAAIWERWIFPGLMNFSSDYRTTAPFSGMHTGGAALDGYLALSFPLLSIWLLARQSQIKVVAAIFLLAAGGYAGLSTFSRGLYAAYACSGAIMAMLLVAPALKKQSWPSMRRLSFTIGVLALIMYALSDVFSSAGYRGFAAALALLLAAGVLGTMRIGWQLWPTTLLCSIAIDATLGSLLSLNEAARGMLKPPYLLFIASMLTFAALFAVLRHRKALILIAFWSMALSALWISYHWSGAAALRPAGFVIALALTLIAINARANLWHIERSSVALAASTAIALALMIPFSASYYALERFGSSRSDLDDRVRHWTQVLGIMDRDLQTQALGMGLGKFPVTYRWRNPLGELPASMSYLDESNQDANSNLGSDPEIDHDIRNRYLRLFAPQYPAGYGEVLRLLQRLPIRPDTDYLLTFDARRQDERSGLNIAICERLLLYPKNCLPTPPFALPPGPDWQHHTLRLASSTLGAASWPARAPIQIAIAVGGDHGFVDIDNISVREGMTGVELIRNGTFSNGNDGWFFSSDRHHLPWHAKNMALNLYFELGWLGVLSFFSLFFCTIVHLLVQAGRGSIHAASYLAALVGFQMVGLFDSLLDVPRLALLFYLVLLFALMLPARPRTQQLRKSSP
jgi:hypothetical protein